MGALIGALTLGSAFPHLARGLVGAFDWRAVITAVSLSSLLGAADRNERGSPTDNDLTLPRSTRSSTSRRR